MELRSGRRVREEEEEERPGDVRLTSAAAVPSGAWSRPPGDVKPAFLCALAARQGDGKINARGTSPLGLHCRRV